MQALLRASTNLPEMGALAHRIQRSQSALRLRSIHRHELLGSLFATRASSHDEHAAEGSLPDREGGAAGLHRDGPGGRKRHRRTLSKTHGSTRDLRLKPSKKLRTHPSKQRERAWQEQHDKKTKGWEASTSSVEASIMEHPEQYFDEKWVHTQGRLSDWPPPIEEETQSHSQSHGRRHRRDRTHHDHDTRAGHTSSANSAPDASGGNASAVLESTSMSQSKGSGSRWKFFASCHPGLEQPLVNELNGPMIRAQDVSPGQSGVTFW